MDWKLGKKWRKMKEWTDEAGRPSVTLHDGTRRSVAEMVCRAFHGEPPTPEHEVTHLDGDRRNCRADNLAWALPDQSPE